MLVASFLVYFTVLLASIAAQRLAPRATIAAFLLGPILLTPYWLAQDYDFTSWFTWAKLYTICAAVLFLNGARAWQRIRAWGPCNAMVLAILLVNILEAVLFDLARGFLLNALVGALILGSAWWGYGATAVRLEGPRRDLLWSTSRLWIVAYTTWNITFVIGAFPTASLMHCAVLGSALAVGMYKPGHWYMARVVTLAVHAVVAMTHPLVLEPMRVPSPRPTRPSPQLWHLPWLWLPAHGPCTGEEAPRCSRGSHPTMGMQVTVGDRSRRLAPSRLSGVDWRHRMWKISLIAAAAMAWGHVAAAQTVAIESNRPVTLAKSNGGSSGVWGANALTLLGNVEDLCMAPCETSIDPGLTTLVAYGKGLASVVEKVDLKADTSYDLKVHTSPRWQRMAGPFGMVWGGLTALTGGLVVSRTDLGIPFLAAGGAIFAGGTALTVTGKRKMTVTVR